MPIPDTLCSLALDQSEVLIRVVSLVRVAADRVGDHFSDHSQKVLAALERSNRKAWKALEVALAGESLWNWFDRQETKALRQQIRAFVDQVEFPELTGKAEYRTRCVRELREAMRHGVLLGSLVPGDLAEKAGRFAAHSDPQSLLDAERKALVRLGAEVQEAGYKALGWLLGQPAHPNQSIVVVSVRYFFRREVETDPELFRGLQFVAVESISQAQADGFQGLEELITNSGQELETALAAVAEQIIGQVAAARVEIGAVHGVVNQVHDSVKGVADSVKGLGDSVKGVQQGVGELRGVVEQATAAATAARGAAETHAADTARRLDELQGQMVKLLDRLDMSNKPVGPAHSISIRTDRERELVRDLLRQVRALPEDTRAARPELVTDIGKLQIAVGDFSGAGESFAAAAALATSTAERAEAHHNAYRARLEQDDFPGALGELTEAVALDPGRFAPFPFDKYGPERILGAGGFGVTFLCRHQLTHAPVAVKAIEDGDLDRDATSILREAMNLDKVKHRAIIGLRDCGFGDEPRRRRPYLVMEYFDGPTLQTHVEKNGPIPLAGLLPLARALAEALQAAHGQGVLHRDIKPANVMVKRVSGGGWEVRLIDFGLAMRTEVLTSSLSTDKGSTVYGTSIAGTLDYAAPEQLGKLPGVKVGPAADVYGFGKTLCFALFGTTDPTIKHYRMVPESMAELIGRCLTRDPAERPQEFAEVLAALRKINPDDAPMAGEAENKAGPWWESMKKAVAPLIGAPPPPPPKSRKPADSTRKSGPVPTATLAPPRAEPAPVPAAIPAPPKPDPPPPRPVAALPLDDDRPAPRRAGPEPPRSPRRPPPREPATGGADRVTHAIVAMLLGAFGIHKFMQGNTNNGIIRVVLGVFLWWITWALGVAEGIQYLTMSDDEYARTYIRGKKDWF